MEPRLFIHVEMIHLVCVDDCLFFVKDSGDISIIIQDLNSEFDLEPVEDVSAFLGIQFIHHTSVVRLN